MNTETLSIEAGNILINEFVGKRFIAFNSNSCYGTKFKTYKNCLKAIEKNGWKGYVPQVGFGQGLGYYHSSWNWLMPVIRKIADLFLNKDWQNFQEAMKRWRPLANELQKVNLENTWFCTVKFIQWYNNQNNQS